MPFTEQIGFGSTAVIAAVASLVGFAAFWSNPDRLVNRGFFAASLFVSSWLICLNQVLTGGGDRSFWGHVTAVAGAIIFAPIWFIKEAIVSDDRGVKKILYRGRWWIMACGVLAVTRTTNWFFLRINISFWVFVVGLAGMYGFLCRRTVAAIRTHVGLKRLELQIALLGGCATGLTVILLLVVRTAADLPWVIRLCPLVVLVFYSCTVVAITTHRVFDARQLVFVGLQKLTLIGTVAGAVYFSNTLLELILPSVAAFLVTVIIGLWFASMLNSWLNNVFQFYPQATAVRQAAFAIARRESRLEELESAFLNVLKGWGQSDRSIIISGGRDFLRGSGIEVPADSVLIKAMRQLRWVTPERLAREKSTKERVALLTFLEEWNLGVLVIGEGPTLTAFIGVGIPASRRPFTYPQVTQLMELASIIESALERAHFSVKAQHAEQLATVGLLGASLAHEIRNPLVSIKTFVQLLPTHHQDPAFREKFFSLISEEVSRIDRLTEQLLDLASPRAYVAEAIELHPVLRASLDLVSAKTLDKRIQVLTDLQAMPDCALTDASAAKQVLLNLCFNAIQAVETRPGDRWVKVSTRNVPLGVEMIVADSGPGIAPEIRSKLFQPFHSTKSTGFGLGLAICNDILGGLNATISVDAPVSGQGAVFRVIFPCPVLSS